MGWFQYYQLLEVYNGDLTKATQKELEWAAKCNPNDPATARSIAEKKWQEKGSDADMKADS